MSTWINIALCFSVDQTVATEMENAIQEMEDQGVQSYILDLRNNPVSLLFSIVNMSIEVFKVKALAFGLV